MQQWCFRLLSLNRTFAMATSDVSEGWKVIGKAQGPGIPAPTGQYRVGCVDLMQQLAGDEKGGLLVRLTYPTEATPAAGYSYSSWYPHHRYIQGFMEFMTKGVVVSKEMMAEVINPQVPALDGAPLYGTNAPIFPVIVFSHGLAGSRTFHSATHCDLASHGYVLASVDHRDQSACVALQRVPKVGGKEGELEDHWLKYYHLGDGEKEFPLRNRQVKQRTDDVRKALDILTLLNEGAEIRDMLGGSYDFKQFKGRMDTSKAGLMGHSFGGATTVQTLPMDGRFKCGLALDASMVPLHKDFYQQTISQPLYFINSHSFQWAENVRKMMALTKPPRDDGVTDARVLTLDGTHHLNQCDLPFVAPHMGLEVSTVDDKQAHKVHMEICRAFLRRHLLNDPAYQGIVPNLDGTEGHSEHIIFGTNLDLTEKPSAQPHTGSSHL